MVKHSRNFRLAGFSVLLLYFVLACANTGFTGSAKQPNNTSDAVGRPDNNNETDRDGRDRRDDGTEDDAEDDDDLDLDQDVDLGGRVDADSDSDLGTDTDTDIGLGADSGDEDGDGELSEEEIVKIKRQCWFAVSGAYFGYHGNGSNEYQSTFPVPSAGGEIAHGAAFDTVGGVFLNAREEPYENGQGDIDRAVSFTFDSIAVAPGMKVEIRNGNGTVLYNGEGPFLGLSSDYGESVSFLRNVLGPRESQMPQWMADKFNEMNYAPPKMPLHAARWVKVSPIPGHKCDWQARQ